MSDTSLFQNLESKKQVLTKASIREVLLSETRYHLIWAACFSILLFPFSVSTIIATICNFSIEVLVFAILLTVTDICLILASIQYAREYHALYHGKFQIITDVLASKDSINRSQWTVNFYHFHVENIFVFESGLRFVRNRMTPTQRDLTQDACVGDTYYLVILDHKPSKPRYIYNTNSFEYKEK